ncbi:MAG: hypothetical protein J6B54_03125 [Clostridia bacterium]|nr:hypothetical protein [Clostridia bacterium]
MDRLLKRYVIVELLVGIAEIVIGLLLGGIMLPALGICTVALAAQCVGSSDKHSWVAVGLGLISLLSLTVSGVSSFLFMTSQTGYSHSTSPLTVLLVLAVMILLQGFLALPLEDRHDLGVLRRGISRTVVFMGIGFGGIVLNYLLSYLFFDFAVSAFSGGDAMQDFHYLEGVLALAMVLTCAREILREFFVKQSPRHGALREGTNDQEA